MPAAEAWQLAHELREELDEMWDAQVENDVRAGRLDSLITHAKDEYARGTCRSMDEIIGDE